MSTTTSTTTSSSCCCSCCSCRSYSSSSRTTAPTTNNTTKPLPCFWQENNMGVHYLNTRNYQQAFHYFRSALVSCKTDVDDHYHNHQEHDHSSSSSKEAVPAVVLEEAGQQHHHASTPPTTSAASSSSFCCCSATGGGCIRYGTSEDSSPFSSSEGATMINKDSMMLIHARGIPMVPLPMPSAAAPAPTGTTATRTGMTTSNNNNNYYFFSPHDPLQEKNICSAIIVFNLGLVFHLQALQEGTGCYHHLTKAFKLYQQTSSLLSISGATTSSISPNSPMAATGNAIIDLVILALINNSADLSMVVLADSNTTNELFQQLINFAVSVRQSSILYYYDYDQQQQHQVGGVATSMNQRVDSFVFNATFAQMMYPISFAPAA